MRIMIVSAFTVLLFTCILFFSFALVFDGDLFDCSPQIYDGRNRIYKP